MRRKNDEEAQIEHHMKKQIDFARRDVARHKREAECERANKWIFDDYFVHRDLADYRTNDVYKWIKEIDVNESESQWDYKSFSHFVIDQWQKKLQSKSRRQIVEI
jgi:hypothetical protein